MPHGGSKCATLTRGGMGPAKDQGSCCREDPLNDSWQVAFSKNGSIIFLVPHALLEPSRLIS